MPAKVFIGSSSKAQGRGLLDEVVLELGTHDLKPIPWPSAFQTGQFTLERLLELTATCEFAVFLFCHDDEQLSTSGDGNSGGRPTARKPVTRDNVLVEYGMFANALSPLRVLILEEEGVTIPADLLGLTTKRFAGPDDETRRAKIAEHIRRARDHWVTLPPLARNVVNDSGLGFQRTVSASRQHASRIALSLSDYANRGATAADPIRFDSLNACITTYCEALGRVENRFWTTSFLTSGFWSNPSTGTEVAEANSRMSRCLRAKGKAPRRLFLTDRPPQAFADAEREQRVHLRRLGSTRELDRLNRAHMKLRENVARLLEEGCEIRVGFDDNRCNVLRDYVAFDCRDSELAIYDEFRVDVFGGGRTGTLNSVECYSKATANFAQRLLHAGRFFEQVWNGAEDAQVFLLRLDRAIEKAQHRIDYTTNWLIRYEFELVPNDANLKTFELGQVLSVLNEAGKAGKVKRYLDVGTCTARYPMQLLDAMTPDGEIFGVDDDEDCIEFAKHKLASKLPNERRIKIVNEDFVEVENTIIEGKFDLITCMLGTLSHFALGPASRNYGALQTALERMAQLLNDDGLLVIGSWSDSACRHRQMLNIYSKVDCELLAERTPSRADLGTLLRAVGLTARRSPFADARLDFWVCRRQGNTPLPIA